MVMVVVLTINFPVQSSRAEYSTVPSYATALLPRLLPKQNHGLKMGNLIFLEKVQEEELNKIFTLINPKILK